MKYVIETIKEEILFGGENLTYAVIGNVREGMTPIHPTYKFPYIIGLFPNLESAEVFKKLYCSNNYYSDNYSIVSGVKIKP